MKRKDFRGNLWLIDKWSHALASVHFKMDTFSQILLSTGLINLSLKNVDKWIESKEIGKLQYALRHGIYDVREKAAQGLGKIKSVSSLPLLFEALDDNVKIVSFAVMKAINEIGVPHRVE